MRGAVGTTFVAIAKRELHVDGLPGKWCRPYIWERSVRPDGVTPHVRARACTCGSRQKSMFLRSEVSDDLDELVGNYLLYIIMSGFEIWIV